MANHDSTTEKQVVTISEAGWNVEFKFHVKVLGVAGRHFSVSAPLVFLWHNCHIRRVLLSRISRYYAVHDLATMAMNGKTGSEDKMGRNLDDPLCICLLEFLHWNVVLTTQPFGEKSNVLDSTSLVHLMLKRGWGKCPRLFLIYYWRQAQACYILSIFNQHCQGIKRAVCWLQAAQPQVLPFIVRHMVLH